ncbi:unnamed protein product [Onchocerca flexuosa]|uniref:ACT domain-containing protein n=1 Tax=Onchocerca flexuosa TaxID=387005 RepID=A0A183HY98_9BILA|nr:unnamed protein product [Onchocerca flexuosa]
MHIANIKDNCKEWNAKNACREEQSGSASHMYPIHVLHGRHLVHSISSWLHSNPTHHCVSLLRTLSIRRRGLSCEIETMSGHMVSVDLTADTNSRKLGVFHAFHRLIFRIEFYESSIIRNLD